jgi:hypothetical protein
LYRNEITKVLALLEYNGMTSSTTTLTDYTTSSNSPTKCLTMGFPYAGSATTQVVFSDDTSYFFGEELDTDRTKEFRLHLPRLMLKWCSMKGSPGISLLISPMHTQLMVLLFGSVL